MMLSLILWSLFHVHLLCCNAHPVLHTSTDSGADAKHAAEALQPIFAASEGDCKSRWSLSEKTPMVRLFMAL